MREARRIQFLYLSAVVFSTLLTTNCARQAPDTEPRTRIKNGVVVSVRDQKLAVIRNGRKVRSYPVSTSKFGIGDSKGSYKTPLGQHKIVAKIGENQPKGMVFKSRKPTGEVIVPGSKGRDPIVSRILWLDGQEKINANAKRRNIYIHGTADEDSIGKPSSYGCIRMTTKDVVDVFGEVGTGEAVSIETCSLDTYLAKLNPPAPKPLPTPSVIVESGEQAASIEPVQDKSLTIVAPSEASSSALAKVAINVTSVHPATGTDIVPPLPADPETLPDTHPEIVDPADLPPPLVADTAAIDLKKSVKTSAKSKGKSKAMPEKAQNKKGKKIKSKQAISKKSKKSSSSNASRSTQSSGKKKATKKRKR